MGEAKKPPYAIFGKSLRTIRELAHESLDEVSGAIEINSDELARIEKGEIRPSEDVLLLLISHFNTDEPDAAKLWEQAGYTKEDTNDQLPDIQHTVVFTPMDARIVYTDVVHVSANNYGVVMNFMQGAGPNGQALAVARIGMSREHAESVIDILQKKLAGTDIAKNPPKRLSSPSEADKTSKR